MDFRKRLLQVLREFGQVVQASINDHDIPGFSRQRQEAAVGHVTPGRTGVFGQQRRRQVQAFQASEAQPGEGIKTVSMSAKEFDNMSLTRPVLCPSL